MFRLLTGSLLLLAAGTTAADTLRIAVATNFRTPLEQIVTEFESVTPHRISLSSASTGQLYAQIINGAPFDIFFAADQARPQKLKDQGLTYDSHVYASGRLALCSSQQQLSNDIAEWLNNGDIKWLAIANPHLAPYGQAAVEVIEQSGSMEKLRDKLVRGENIGQVYQFMTSGNVTAAFVAETQHRLTDPDTVSCRRVPATMHAPVIQEAVLLTQNKAAQDFMEFVRSPAITTIISGAGYDLPEQE